MKTLIPIFAGGLLLVCGCEKSITINLPAEPQKLVLNAVVPRGQPIYAHLTRTLSNAESGKGLNVSVTGAQLVLYVDGQAADTLEYESDGFYLSEVEATAGHRYRLKVTHPSYPGVEAETDAPAQIPLQTPVITRNARTTSNNGDQDLLQLRFRDPAGTGNHYIIQVLGGYNMNVQSLDFYSWDNCINIADPSFESPYSSEFPGEETCLPSRSLLLRDGLFDGQEKEVRLFASTYTLRPHAGPGGIDSTYPVVRMYHVTPEFYRFVKSYRSAQDASGNPFVEPFNIAGNVKGGYGVFSILNEEEYELRD